eukprot:gene53998-37757_t
MHMQMHQHSMEMHPQGSGLMGQEMHPQEMHPQEMQPQGYGYGPAPAYVSPQLQALPAPDPASG